MTVQEALRTINAYLLIFRGDHDEALMEAMDTIRKNITEETKKPEKGDIFKTDEDRVVLLLEIDADFDIAIYYDYLSRSVSWFSCNALSEGTVVGHTDPKTIFKEDINYGV